MANVAQLIINITANSTQATSAINQVNSQVNRMGNSINRSMNGAGNSIMNTGNLLKQAFAVSAIIVGIETLAQGIGRLINGGIEFIKTIDDTKMAFQIMTQDNIELADNLLNKVIELARTSPLSTENVAKSAQTMVGFGVEVSDVTMRLQQLGDISRGNNERFDKLSLAFAQVTAAGRLMGQEVLQFNNAGFNPLAQMAKTMSKEFGGLASSYMPKLQQAMRDGEISVALVGDALSIATGKGGMFEDAMIKMTKTFSGQMNIMKDNVIIIIGGVLKPLVDWMTSVFLPVFNAVLEKIITMFAFFGIDLKKNADSAKTSMDGIAGSFDDSTDAINKQKKALQSNLQSFDQLHTLQKESSSKSGTGGLGSMDGLGKVLADAAALSKKNPVVQVLSDIEKSVNDFLARMKGAINFEALENALNKLKKALEPFSKTIGSGLVYLWNNVLKPLGKWTINELVPKLIENLAAKIGKLNAMLKSAKPYFKALFEDFLIPLGKWTGGIIIKVLDAMNMKLEAFTAWYNGDSKTFDELKGKIENLSLPISILATLVQSYLTYNFAKLAFTIAGKVVGSLVSFVANIVRSIVATTIFTAKLGKDLILALINSVKYLYLSATALIKTSSAWIWNTTTMLRARIAAIAMWVVTKSLAIMQGVLRVALLALPWVALIAAIAAVVGGFVYLMETNQNFRKVVSQVIGGLGYLIATLQNGVMDALSFVAKGFLSLAELSANAMLDVFINPVIRGLNGLIAVMNETTGTTFSPFKEISKDASLISDMKKDVENFFNKGKMMNPENFALEIASSVDSYFANKKNDPNSLMNTINGLTSGIGKSPSAADTSFVGSNGDVTGATGADNTESLANMIANAVVQAMGTINGGTNKGGNQTIELNIDGQKIATAITPHLEKEKNRIGQQLIRAT